MFRIKRGDKVVVLTGKDKGKIGSVFRIFRSKRTKLLMAYVNGVNVVKKHCKQNVKNKISGGVYSIELGINLSKLSLVNNISQKADKVNVKFISENGVCRKVRIFKSDKREI